jgi:hypothetical protein
VYNLAKLTGIIVISTAISACASQGMGGGSPKELFSLVTTPEGNIYRTNTRTGEVWIVKDGQLKRVNELKPQVLEIGKKYFIEDNFSMTYLGKGKFTEPVKDFSRLWN